MDHTCPVQNPKIFAGELNTKHMRLIWFFYWVWLGTWWGKVFFLCSVQGLRILILLSWRFCNVFGKAPLLPGSSNCPGHIHQATKHISDPKEPQKMTRLLHFKPSMQLWPDHSCTQNHWFWFDFDCFEWILLQTWISKTKIAWLDHSQLLRKSNNTILGA